MNLRYTVSSLRSIGNALLLTALLLTSSGCASVDDKKIQKAIAEADRVAVNEPMRAVAIVDNAMEVARNSCEDFIFVPCPSAKEKADAKYHAVISKARLSYLAVALERKDAAAIEYLFFSPFPGGDAGDLRISTAPWILAQLEAQARLDPRVQRTAALLLSRVPYVIPDTKRAIAVLRDAWLAGLPQAAGDAALILYDIGDFPSAYMWSLRCPQVCDFGGRTLLAKSRLSTAGRLRAEDVARDTRQVDMPLRASDYELLAVAK